MLSWEEECLWQEWIHLQGPTQTLLLAAPKQRGAHRGCLKATGMPAAAFQVETQH